MNQNTSEFLDIMNDANTIAQRMGYCNAVDWARKTGKGNVALFQRCHNLRNQIAHGGASTTEIYPNTLKEAKNILQMLRNEEESLNAPQNKKSKKKLPGFAIFLMIVFFPIGIILLLLYFLS